MCRILVRSVWEGGRQVAWGWARLGLRAACCTGVGELAACRTSQSTSSLVLGLCLGVRELSPGCHVLDHPCLCGPVLLWLRQWVPLHIVQVSPPRTTLPHLGSVGARVGLGGRCVQCYTLLFNMSFQSCGLFCCCCCYWVINT